MNKQLPLVLILLIATMLFFIPSSAHISSEIKNISGKETPIARLTCTANLYFIFINGLGTYCDGNPFNCMGFTRIRESLIQAGYSYCDNHFLLYSYTGGQIHNRCWHPNSYTKKDTGQSLTISKARLAELLEQHSSVHPQSRYILVGHSLGGRIALDYATSTCPKYRHKIKGVITLNSPLAGVEIKLPALLVRMLVNYENIWTSTAVKQLLHESFFDEELSYLRSVSIKRLQEEGIRVATFAHKSDLLVSAKTSCIKNEKGTYATEGFSINDNSFFFAGHTKILDSQIICNYISTAFFNAVPD